jgi:hypothetical protein
MHAAWISFATTATQVGRHTTSAAGPPYASTRPRRWRTIRDPGNGPCGRACVSLPLPRLQSPDERPGAGLGSLPPSGVEWAGDFRRPGET